MYSNTLWIHGSLMFIKRDPNTNIIYFNCHWVHQCEHNSSNLLESRLVAQNEDKYILVLECLKSDVILEFGNIY